METPICDYCGQPSERCTGKEVYPHRPDLHDKVFYRCLPCDARVGAHPATGKPLGRLANAELRRWKRVAHAVFDPIWQERLRERQGLNPEYTKSMARGGRYKRLAQIMGMTRDECHIGLFNIEQCRRVIEICESGLLHE